MATSRSDAVDVTRKADRGRKRVCVRGHLLTDENSYLYLDAKGKRRRKCRECTRMHSQKQIEKRKEARRRYVPCQGGIPATTGKRTDECMDASIYLALAEQRERAATHWERAEIEQRMEKMRKGA